MELSSLGLGRVGEHEHKIPNGDTFFTPDKPVIMNFHGYPETIKTFLLAQKNPERFSVHGYIENGSTTTPFDMQVMNHTDRLHLAIHALEILSGKSVEREKARFLIEKYNKMLKEHREYIIKFGVDPEYIEQWQWKKNI